MKKILSLFLCISLIMALFVPTMIFSASATTVDAGNIDLSKLEFAYALRGNAENVYPSYNETDGCYDITILSMLSWFLIPRQMVVVTPFQLNIK